MDSNVVLTEKNPNDEAGFLSKIFLWWSFPLFKRGYKQGLTIDDLFQARNNDNSGRLGDRLERAWLKEVENCKNKKDRPSLIKAIVSCFWVEYMMCGLLVGLLFIILWPRIPYILALFIEYFAGVKTPETYKNAHIYNFALNLLMIVNSLMFNHVNLSQSCVGMRVRIAACSVLYRKILKLNRIGLSQTEAGQVINLMSNDVNRFDQASSYLHYIWVMPIAAPVLSYLVWQHIGVATLAALAVIFMQTVLIQAYLSRSQGVYRGKIAKRTDQRVKVMSELVNGVQVIKMYAWEKPFEKLVDKLRKLEVKFILRTSYIKGFSIALSVFTERFILFAAVITFVVLGGEIRAGITFSLVQYCNLMQMACSIYFPLALATAAEARVSVRRLEDFLLLEELDKEETKLVGITPNILSNGSEKDNANSKYKPSTLVLSNLSASWQTNPIVHTLRNISLTAHPGEFVGVAGLVGSGKSTLLQVILGELPPAQGSITIGGARIAYASQEPWLFVATVKQNILFGLPYDKLRYKKVVTACALLRDFEQLPHGDATLVGERGISLSGGQRARIGLARACYRNADIYLLDDPLSAVDTHVGKHLISECVMGLLRHSTRILVTHQLHHLKNADKIVILRNGEVETQGTFDEVSKTKLFEELLQEEETDEDAGNRGQLLRQQTMSIQGEVETQGTFDEVSKIKLFEELLQEEETDEDAGNRGQLLRQQTMSIQSHASISTMTDNAAEELEEEAQETSELMEKGRVSGKVYMKYFRAGSGWCLLSSTIMSVILAQLVTSASDLWVTYWMNSVDENVSRLQEKKNIGNSSLIGNNSLSNISLSNASLSNDEDTFNSTSSLGLVSSTTMSPKFTVIGTMVKTAVAMNNMTSNEAPFDHSMYMYVWAIGILGCIIFTTGRSLMFLWVCMRSSVKLHNQMFSSIMSATMRFFDTNPSGRILNRFSKDMGVIDEIIPMSSLDTIQVFMVMIGILVMVAIVNPYMLLTTAFCGVFMYFWSIIFLNTAQAIKRVEGVARSPVFSHVSASMSGLFTVRACGAQELLRAQFDDKQDVHTAAWYLTLVTSTTFAIYLSLFSSLYVVIVSYTFLLLDDGTTKSGNVGLAISQGLILVNIVHHGIRMTTEVVSQMISVERVLQFTKLPQEAVDGPPAPRDWPTKARLVFKDLYLRYDREAEPVLRDLNIVIESGWKVGVVGRTGAGKSSLISALFRLAPIDGHVLIDDVDTGEIALKDLRSRISIIPQEPVLFSASLRYNLDPFDKYTDAEIWMALEQVELKQSVSSLSSSVEAGGANFSAGQRQLLCLARAALARNRLLVLDEATANVDPNTDALIQKSIRKCFSDCTVLTVAHRLHTVADSDRVVVMEAGRIVECGHPHDLLQNENGHFTKMVNQLGPASEQSLRESAHKAYLQHIKYVDADDQTQ